MWIVSGGGFSGVGDPEWRTRRGVWVLLSPSFWGSPEDSKCLAAEPDAQHIKTVKPGINKMELEVMRI